MSDQKKSISLPLANPEASIGGNEELARPQSAQDLIQELVENNPVVIFMKGIPDQPMCGFSARASAILGSYGKPFHAINVLMDPEIRQGVKDFSNWPTIPQVYVGGEFLGGSDILIQMHQNGELAAMIATAYGDE